jgi:hypothetical protein
MEHDSTDNDLEPEAVGIPEMLLDLMSAVVERSHNVDLYEDYLADAEELENEGCVELFERLIDMEQEAIDMLMTQLLDELQEWKQSLE